MFKVAITNQNVPFPEPEYIDNVIAIESIPDGITLRYLDKEEERLRIVPLDDITKVEVLHV